jgi:Flp pilus assembly protein TadD
MQQGKLDSAAEHFREAQRIDPNFFKAYSNLGSVFLKQGKFDQAKKQYIEALKINPNSAEDNYNLGLVFLSAPCS